MGNDKVKLSCPHCGLTGMAPRTLIGISTKCSKCGQVFVPKAEEPLPPPSSPPTAERPPKPLEEPVRPEQAAPADDSPYVPTPQPPEPPQATQPQVPEQVREEVSSESDSAAEAAPAGRRMRVNRVLAGKVCPACSKEALLGEEVVCCEECGSVSHAVCWDERGGCASRRCSDGGVEADMAGAVTCPSCAESIPEDSRVCPYCGEACGGESGLLPVSFMSGKGALFQNVWSWTASPSLLEGKAPGMPDIEVPREEASSRITLKSGKMLIEIDGERRKFLLDDIGHMAMRSFLGQPRIQRTSAVARDALITAIVGIFCCQIIFGPVAITRAGRAKEMINLYPEDIGGRGLATAATIIGTIDIVIFVVYMVLNALQKAGA